MSDPCPEYANRVTAFHRELGIFERYGADRRLTLQVEAAKASLETIAERADGIEIQLTPAAAQAWRDLHEAAANDGVGCSLSRDFAASGDKWSSSATSSKPDSASWKY